MLVLIKKNSIKMEGMRSVRVKSIIDDIFKFHIFNEKMC